MRRMRHFVLVLAVLGAAFGAPIASAADRTPFVAVVTEEFCGPVTTCGTALTSAGRATVGTVITSFDPLPSGCFADSHTTTLTYDDSSTLAIAISGTLCPTAFPNFRLTGTWTVAGGTGRFAGATGSGVVGSFRQNGPIHAVIVGTMKVQGGDG